MNRMLRVTVLILAAMSLGCTITVRPITASTSPKKKHSAKSRHYASSKTVKSQPSPIPNNIKETWWVENYHKLEAARGDYTIPDDANIEPLPDGRFKIPDAVLHHYQDLLLAKPSPEP